MQKALLFALLVMFLLAGSALAQPKADPPKKDGQNKTKVEEKSSTPRQFTTEDAVPLILLGVGVLCIFVMILYLKTNPFMALISAALLIGLLSPRVLFPGGTETMDLVNAPTLVAFKFGDTMRKIGLAIAFATIIGKAMMESGAADRIVRYFTKLFGDSFTPFALLASGFVLSIPVFFDTVFLLLIPLAKALRIRTGKDYLLYVTAIGAGGAVTHGMVPPTPGPIGMSAELKVDLGYTIVMGTMIGLPMALIGFVYANWINRVSPVPLRETGGVTLDELEERSKRDDSQLPALWISFLPIVLPVLFITANTVIETLAKQWPDVNPTFMIGSASMNLLTFLAFLGNPTIALLLSAVISMLIVAFQTGMSRNELGVFTTKSLDDAGMILLITSAGGAFGGMLQEAGVGNSLDKLSEAFGVSLLVLGWLLAVLFKLAQGSGTVSMLTTAAILMGIISRNVLNENGLPAGQNELVTPEMMGAYLGYHPVYVVMAIGAGSKVGSWMNDSGFWVVCKMGGLTELETFKSWTICLTIMGVCGLPIVLLLSQILPLVGP